MKKATLRKLRATPEYLAIGRELGSGGYRNYSAKAAQKDLDIHTAPGEYFIDGNTYHGYEIVHRASGKTVVRNFSPRDLVILTVSLWRTAADRE